MPPKYMRAALNSGLTYDDLKNVTTIEKSNLEALVKKFNYSAEALRKKSGTTGPCDYMNELGIRNTDQLTSKLNEKVNAPNQPLPHDAAKELCRGPALLMHLIDYMWLQWIEPVAPHMIKSYKVMEDPDTDGGPRGQMLSSRKHGFKKFGISFRGDTRSYEEFDQYGFAARYSLPPGHSHHISEAYGTVAAQSMAFDRVGRDFLNQTGVCVARNLLGSMKFVGSRDAQTPNTVLNRSGYMFAVQFETGVDTERMQLDKILSQPERGKDHSILWRAGEKAAYQIPKRNFLASCRFEVDNPYHTDINPLFKFRRLTNWTFHTASVSARAYLIDAVSAIETGKWYEFTRAHDWGAS